MSDKPQRSSVNIKAVLEDYMDNKKEYEEIQKEIGNFRKSYKTRLDNLNKSMNSLQGIILEYMEINNFPAMKYNNINFELKTSKKIADRKNLSRKKKEEVLNSFKKKNNLDDEQYADLYNGLLGKQEIQQNLKLSKPKMKS